MSAVECFEITGVVRDPAGRILGYCGDQPFRWQVFVTDLVDDIEGGRYRYVVSGARGRKIDVVVSVGGKGKYVRSDPDAGADLIEQLPRC